MPILKESVTSSDGEEVTIHIEVDTVQPRDLYYDDLRGQGSQVVDAAKDVFGSGMKLIRTCAKQVISSIQQLDQLTRPTEFEVQLAIKLDSEVGAILAKAKAGAQLQVTMKWVKAETGMSGYTTRNENDCSEEEE